MDRTDDYLHSCSKYRTRNDLEGLPLLDNSGTAWDEVRIMYVPRLAAVVFVGLPYHRDATDVDPEYMHTTTIHGREFQKFSVKNNIHFLPVDDVGWSE